MTAAYRIDGREVTAETFYAAACDPKRSVVIEACAGAGKTWMLVSRILRALLDGVAPEQILAITFTRKAAGEMRQRLDEWLAGFDLHAATPAEREQALRDRGLDADAARQLAPALGDLRQGLLRRARAVEVRTFHAWFAQLAGQVPMQLRGKLGLPAEPVLLEDPEPLHDELFRRFQRRVWADAALRADHDTLVARHRRQAVQQWLDAAWRRGDELALADEAGVLEQSMPDAAELDARFAGLADPLQALAQPEMGAAWLALARVQGAHTGKIARAAAEVLVEAGQQVAVGEVHAAFAAVWQALFTKEGTLRRGLLAGPELDAVAQALQAVDAAQQQQLAHDDHQRMVRLSRVLREEYRALKRQRALVDMPDLERAALALLSDPVAAGWVQQRLDLRVQQLLIDEFQDTSPLQWHALFGWLSAYAGAGGGASGQRPPGVFIVGDPKQSIYRFRRAEPRVFEAARDFVVQGLDGQVLSCDHTRRNALAVMAAVNQVCGDAARLEGWGPFRAHTTASTEPGAVRALPLVPRPPKDDAPTGPARWRDSLTEPRHEPSEHLKLTEARQVARAIADLARAEGVDPGRVMVLSRQRAMLVRVAQALAESGLPCVMPDALSLADAGPAQDLVAVLDVLASPGHDLSLARALKSPLFGCSDDDLLRLSGLARQRSMAWIDALAALHEDARTPALRRAGQLMGRWRALAASLTPHELLDRVLHDSDALGRLLAATPPARRTVALQVVRGLLQAALEHEGGRFVSTYRFVRAVRQGLLRMRSGAPVGAVQLLTVHGAKGLEADVVFIVDAAPEPRRPESSTLLVDWPVDAAAPRRAAFVRSESRMAPALRPLLEQEQAERAREEVNGLYVALTRARRLLVVSATEPHRGVPPGCWWQRLQAAAQPWLVDAGDASEARSPASLADVGVTLEQLPELPPSARPTPEPDAQAETTQDARAAALGRAVHRLLEWMGQPGQPLPVAERAAAAQQAVLAFGLPAAAATQALAVATAIADSPDCRPFFAGPALHWAGAEVPVADGGQLLRVDRLVCLRDAEGRNTWWVLDYKLRHRPEQLEAYRTQLDRYCVAVRQAMGLAPGTTTQGDRVRGGFITGAGAFVPL